MPAKLKSVLNRLDSRPSFMGECASEFDTRVNPSRSLTRQFIKGSEERPVSTANMFEERSSKHSSIASKPDLEPNRENQGVQIWAGIRNPSSVVSSRISSRSLESSPRIGLPSDFILPILSRRELNLSAASRFGRKTRL